MKINRVVQNSLKLTSEKIENLNTFITLNYRVIDKIMCGYYDRFNPNRCKKLVFKKPKPIINKDINPYQ